MPLGPTKEARIGRPGTGLAATLVNTDFDIVIVGGGHAGAEAAWAASRLGLRAALVTLSAGDIAQMSCNPAIGGLGKGQIVREIDALGGLMALAADATGMQFRVLNRSKGPAVQGPRCQSDRHAYAAFVRDALHSLADLTIIEGEATDILTDGERVTGVTVVTSASKTHGSQFVGLDAEKGQEAHQLRCRAAIITAGTFLRGMLHCGEKTWPGGRQGEPAAEKLSVSLERLGIRLGRLKTGTCPRVAAESIDYSRCIRQDGDDPPTPFSFMTDRLDVAQEPCWITHTNEAIHQLIRDNFDQAPLFTGQISATGPRYCPSLELKVKRFPDKTRHQVFIEPEGRETNWVYLNGVSTSLPMELQERIVRSLPGLEQGRIIRWGYAIEYDYADPTQLKANLETKSVAGLFLAGQINGTTGYEEAAAQGLIAAVNAARSINDAEPLVLARDQAYIGVMIDDLVTKGVVEPYRMFTSRAEYRLILRADNADRRLTPIGRAAGLVDDARWERYSAKAEAVGRARELLSRIRLDGKSLADHFARPHVQLEQLFGGQAGKIEGPAELFGPMLELWRDHRSAIEAVAIDRRYAGYVKRQQAHADKLRNLEQRLIPESLDYSSVPHLRAEACQRLDAIRPRTLGQALRVSGVTPADITVLMVHLGAGKQG